MFSNRDNKPARPICCSPLRSQSGQGTIEYLLILVVAVAIILGSLYQLNSAFKAWANNYFGDYLSCLLETGELPTIGGNPGDSNTCEQFFKPFTMAEGRPKTGGDKPAEKSSDGDGRGSREKGGGGAPTGRYGGGGGGGRFGRSATGSPTRLGKKLPGSTSFTGNTDASGGGGSYSYYQRPVSHKTKSKLDTKFAFESQRDKDQRRKVASTSKKDEGGVRGAIKMKPKNIKKAESVTADTGFSVGNFIRILIIVCIILALAIFIGGQILQISKSMD